jgi:hypothetical protein
MELEVCVSTCIGRVGGGEVVMNEGITTCQQRRLVPRVMRLSACEGCR